jgi:hypothetical protein
LWGILLVGVAVAQQDTLPFNGIDIEVVADHLSNTY